jgi:hypothetical protein
MMVFLKGKMLQTYQSIERQKEKPVADCRR